MGKAEKTIEVSELKCPRCGVEITALEAKNGLAAKRGSLDAGDVLVCSRCAFASRFDEELGLKNFCMRDLPEHESDKLSALIDQAKETKEYSDWFRGQTEDLASEIGQLLAARQLSLHEGIAATLGFLSSPLRAVRGREAAYYLIQLTKAMGCEVETIRLDHDETMN